MSGAALRICDSNRSVDMLERWPVCDQTLKAAIKDLCPSKMSGSFLHNSRAW